MIPPSFNVMVKPRGPICNCRCEYCYYLPKEHLYPDGDFHMSAEMLENFTRQYIAAQKVPEVIFSWQGGEPLLMGLDFFKTAVRFQEEYGRPGLKMSNSLQTNGFLLNDEWCRFFKEHNFLIGISIDGPGRLHDTYRVDLDNKPTLDRVMAGVELLKKHAVEFNTLSCVHSINAEHPIEVYRFLRDEVQSQFLQFIPIVVRDNQTEFPQKTAVTEHTVSGKQYGKFLTSIFDEWVRRDVGKVFVQAFDTSLAAWLGRPPGLCVFDKTCGTAMVLEHNGDLYACDHFVESEYLLGNLAETGLETLVGSEKQTEFGLAKRDALPKYCTECPVRFVCNGGCPRNRISYTPDGEPGLNYLCEGYRAFFAHINGQMKFMAAELNAGRPPSNVMYETARQDAEIRRQLATLGRNDPCPCGSGRKVKQCHGKESRY
jgi:uncharacterized protein